jgi:hypothetical protein
MPVWRVEHRDRCKACRAHCGCLLGPTRIPNLHGSFSSAGMVVSGRIARAMPGARNDVMKSPMRARDPFAMRLAAALVALGAAGPVQAHDASLLLLIVPVFFLPAILASLLAGPGRRMLALVVTLALYGIGVLLLAYLPDRVMDKDQVMVLAFFLPWTGLVYAGYLRYRHDRASHLRA